MVIGLLSFSLLLFIFVRGFYSPDMFQALPAVLLFVVVSAVLYQSTKIEINERTGAIRYRSFGPALVPCLREFECSDVVDVKLDERHDSDGQIYRVALVLNSSETLFINGGGARKDDVLPCFSIVHQAVKGDAQMISNLSNSNLSPRNTGSSRRRQDRS